MRPRAGEAASSYGNGQVTSTTAGLAFKGYFATVRVPFMLEWMVQTNE